MAVFCPLRFHHKPAIYFSTYFRGASKSQVHHRACGHPVRLPTRGQVLGENHSSCVTRERLRLEQPPAPAAPGGQAEGPLPAARLRSERSGPGPCCAQGFRKRGKGFSAVPKLEQFPPGLREWTEAFSLVWETVSAVCPF